ncbi:MAG: MotA/TolQ/ExbB proton channel family protein [Planctomycetes bacterium]|nr:MotA/TolQ/ExbB proton channel family protein [Planctomycetota bacterium]
MSKSKSTPNSRFIDRIINGIVTSPWMWGTAVTFAFYAALPFVPIYQETISRYFTAHWIEYATTSLFFIGTATLLMKAARIPAERSALGADLLDGLKLEESQDAVGTARGIDTHLDLVARRCEDSLLVRRIRDVIDYVIGRRSADGLEGHLNYLSDLAAGRLHDGYSLIRTITWAVPILGFLGTVIGITMAIANITPDQLESSLPEVTSGLAVAFDTTALSLALSMILVFGTFIIERAEQRTLDDVEDVGIKQLICLFPSAGAPVGPLVSAEAEAAAQLLKRTEGMINWQMELWETSLESLRERWASTLSRQQEVLDQAFQSGLTNALTDHSEQLAAARTEFVRAYEASSMTIARQVAESQAALVEQQQHSATLISETWQAFHSDLTAARDGQTESMTRLTDSLTGAVMVWSDRLEEATRGMTDQLRELRQQGTTLLKLTEQESELVRLEERLAQNLDSVRVVDSLEETLLNLNAAVNLMTARVKGKAA